MICPNCRNEYFDEPVCPQCGKDEISALRVAAEGYDLQERFDLSMEYWGKVLRKAPSDIEALRKRAVAGYRKAQGSANETSLRQSWSAVQEALERDWSWEIGHQYLVQIADKLGTLEELEKEYQESEKDPERAEMGRRMVWVIQLVRQYKWQPPERSFKLPGDPEWIRLFKAYWPILPAYGWVLWVWKGLVTAIRDQRRIETYLGLLLIGLFLFSLLLLYTVRDNRKKKQTPRRKTIL